MSDHTNLNHTMKGLAPEGIPVRTDDIFDKLDDEVSKGVHNIDIDFFTGKAVSTKGD